MDESMHLVVMGIDTLRFALRLEDVDRVLRAVEVTPLPEAPPIVLGVVNIQGRVIPAINLRRRCRLPERPIDLADQFVIAHTQDRVVALIVDTAEIEQFPPTAIIPADNVVPESDFVRSVVKDKSGMILVCDLDELLSMDEETTLSGAINCAVDAK